MLENAFKKIKAGDVLVVVKNLAKQRELSDETADNNIRVHIDETMEQYAGDTLTVSRVNAYPAHDVISFEGVTGWVWDRHMVRHVRKTDNK